MKRLLSFLAILFIGVISSACVNTFAVHELNENAAKFSKEGNYKDAISRLEAVIDLDENVYETRYNLAVAYLGVNKCEKALQHIEIAEKLSKEKIAVVYYTKGVINSCLADNVKEKTDDDIDEDTDDETSKDKTIDDDDVTEETLTAQEANAKYISYLKAANESFKKYLALDKEAQDKDEVEETIARNQSVIDGNTLTQE